jgi:hypothetical protein
VEIANGLAIVTRLKYGWSVLNVDHISILDKIQVVNADFRSYEEILAKNGLILDQYIGLYYNTGLYWLNILDDRIVKFQFFFLYVQLETV